MKRVNVVCVNWGKKYSPEYVFRLHNMIESNTTHEFKMFCLTDTPEIYTDKIKGVLLKPGLEGWWNKMQLFREDVLPRGEYIYFDLDVVIVDNIDCLFEHEGFGIIRDFINPDDGLLGGKEYNSSVMKFTQDRELWTYFTENQSRWREEQQRCSFFGDQNVISDFLNKKGFDKPFPDQWIWSFKVGTVRGKRPLDHTKWFGTAIPKGGKICVFHGQPNPDQVIVPWVTENWRCLKSGDEEPIYGDQRSLNDSKLTNFIVIAPPYNSKSVGSIVLYNLVDEIRSLGYRATRVLLTQRNDQFFISVDAQNYMPLGTETLAHLFDSKNSVIIHGENLHHRFFDSFNVARFYLNKIGALRNVGVPKKGEYKIAWNKNFVDAPDFILRKIVIKKPVHENLQLHQPRLIDLTYVGKGQIYNKSFGRLPGTIELTRVWPNDVDEYLLLLSKARFLFTYDVTTTVIEEAIFYGVIPVLMTHLPMKSMSELNEFLPSELAECCLSSEEFEKLDSENIESFFDYFFQKRQSFLGYLEKHETEYKFQLDALISDISEKFELIPQSQKNATVGT